MGKRLAEIDKKIDAHMIVLERVMNAVQEIAARTTTPQFYGPEAEPPGVLVAASVICESVFRQLDLDVLDDGLVDEYHAEREEMKRLALEERVKAEKMATALNVQVTMEDVTHGG
jgi:hypothetical protein